MAKPAFSNIKLGTLVICSVVVLVLLLYLIGKNQHLFGSNFMLKARFENVQGLITGNNVRFAGIESGTVKRIDILNDSTVEVTMLLDKKLEGVICKNAVARIGTEGFVGNKVVNINPAKESAPYAAEGDILATARSFDTDEILQTFSKTNTDLAAVAAGLKNIIQRINRDNALWGLLEDKTLPKNIRRSVEKLNSTMSRASNIALSIDSLVNDVKNGKGTVGMILRDSAVVLEISSALVKINEAGDHIDSLSKTLDQMLYGLNNDLNNKSGVVNALLRDSVLTQRFNETIENLRQGTDGFNQNMEALKHSIFFRGYFKKLERQKQQEAKAKEKAKQ